MNTLSVKLEDMKEGVIYRDKFRKPYILSPCEICGKPRAVTLLHGKPLTIRCHPCSNGTLEKRAIMSKAHKGIPYTKEVVERRTKVLRKIWDSPEWRAKISQITKGRIVSEKTKTKLRLANKGKLPSLGCRTARKKKMDELWADKNWAEKEIARLRQCRLDVSPETEATRRQKISKSSKQRWADSQYKEETIRAMFKARAFRPTRPEIKLDRLLQENFPNQWLYNGDFSSNVIIGGLVPDFVNINGRKQCLELFGDYFHKPSKYIKVTPLREEGTRIEKLKEFGWDCLVIWEREMKNPQEVLVKIREFNGRKQ